MRIVMFVFNDMTADVRVAREAASLAAGGHEVTVMARPRDVRSRVGEVEVRDGFTIQRIPVPDRWRRPWTIVTLPARVLRKVRRTAGGDETGGARTADFLVKWRFAVLGWNHRAGAAAPAADIYHGHDLSGLAAAVDAAERHHGRVVYDSHELFVEAGSNARQPAWVRRRLRALEQRLASRAVALITVNESISAELGRVLGIGRRVVVYNAPETPAADRLPDREASPLRAAIGSPDAPIVLYHGGFLASRGLETLIAAFREPSLAGVHLALLGSGPLDARLRSLAADPALGGCVRVLRAVPPSELLAWVVGADVGAMVNQPASENERLSTPNKLFESLAVGLPVVSSDFPERRRIVMDDPEGPLGAVCDPTRPAAVAAAIAGILALDGPARDALHARCRRAATERWNWDRERTKLLDLYAELSAEAAR